MDYHRVCRTVDREEEYPCIIKGVSNGQREERGPAALSYWGWSVTAIPYYDCRRVGNFRSGAIHRILRGCTGLDENVRHVRASVATGRDSQVPHGSCGIGHSNYCLGYSWEQGDGR